MEICSFCKESKHWTYSAGGSTICLDCARLALYRTSAKFLGNATEGVTGVVGDFVEKVKKVL